MQPKTKHYLSSFLNNYIIELNHTLITIKERKVLYIKESAYRGDDAEARIGKQDLSYLSIRRHY